MSDNDRNKIINAVGRIDQDKRPSFIEDCTSLIKEFMSPLQRMELLNILSRTPQDERTSRVDRAIKTLKSDQISGLEQGYPYMMRLFQLLYTPIKQKPSEYSEDACIGYGTGIGAFKGAGVTS